MLDHRRTYSPIRKTHVDLIAANLFNRIKKGLRWRSEIPGVRHGIRITKGRVWLSDHPSSKCVQRLQLRWPVRSERVGGTHSGTSGIWETDKGQTKALCFYPIGYHCIFKCVYALYFLPTLLILHTYYIHVHTTFIKPAVIISSATEDVI